MTESHRGMSQEELGHSNPMILVIGHPANQSLPRFFSDSEIWSDFPSFCDDFDQNCAFLSFLCFFWAISEFLDSGSWGRSLPVGRDSSPCKC